MAQKQYVYFYGVSKELTEGDRSMKAVLGGKGAIWLKWQMRATRAPRLNNLNRSVCLLF